MKRNAKNWRRMKQVYSEIWEERGFEQCKRLCSVCKVGIGEWDMDSGTYEWRPHHFQHIKRGRRKGEWDDKNNIKLICMPCHAKEDHGERVIHTYFT